MREFQVRSSRCVALQNRRCSKRLSLSRRERRAGSLSIEQAPTVKHTVMLALGDALAMVLLEAARI